jgi:hypothetical protein
VEYANNNNPVSNQVTILKSPHLEVAPVNSKQTSFLSINTNIKLTEIGGEGAVFFFAALIVNFVLGLTQIVFEKELKLRDILKIMGVYVTFCMHPHH